MKLPRFLDRVLDATTPILAGLDRDLVRRRLESSSVTLRGGELAAREPDRDGFLLAANLLARLYPRICLLGPDKLLDEAEGEIVLINPRAEILRKEVATDATLAYQAPGKQNDAVAVAATGWEVFLDRKPRDAAAPSTAAPAALFAAALGVGELFRTVFAAELGPRGRSGAQPGTLNLITLAEHDGEFALAVPEEVELGEFRLLGLGAIGQAAAHTLACSGARGTLVAVDPEKIELSNLQRYVLTRDSDLGAIKVELTRERLRRSALQVLPIESEWHAGLVERQLPTLVALDSAEARIGVQASLPGPLYNAFTQPADIGFSRHERFGEEPCLACLYWPERERPGRHQQIAAALGQHPLRILGYLISNIPVGAPLPQEGIPVIPGVEPPADAAHWSAVPLIEDIAVRASEPGQLDAWRQRALADLYQEGICGGALLHLGLGDAPREVLVPLAHQSALAGIMLAIQFIVASVPALRAARPALVEARYDVLAGLPQILPRPRQASRDCICTDSVFQRVYSHKVQAGEGPSKGEKHQREGAV